MAGEGPSELPLHYGGKTSHGELIKRPSTPPGLPSPRRSYQPSNAAAYSPELTPVDPTHPFTSFDSDSTRVNGGGLRRKPTTASGRRHSLSDYERANFPLDSSSRRPLRPREDDYYSDRERSTSLRKEEYSSGHPDQYERSRPPRTYRNTDAWDRPVPASVSKPYFGETRDYRDLERGQENYMGERKQSADEVSVDGYNYEAHKRANRGTIDFKNLTKEERAEVMRLPWTQWMDSNVKNRESLSESRPSTF